MRIGIVGLGHAGFDIHLPALAGIRSAVVVGACDADASRQAEATARWRIPAFGDLDAMLGQTRPEAVIVATPPASHAELCVRALAAGAHVICEKPFVSSLREADRVLAAAQTAGRQVAVNHEFREMPIFRTLIGQVRERTTGDLRFVQAWQLTDLPPSSESGWRGEMAHRTLFEAGVHLVDLILALFGEKPRSVEASTGSGGEEADGDALVVATLAFSRGRLAQLLLNRVCKGERQYLEVRADTEGSSFRASFGGRARLSAGLFRSVVPHVRFEYGTSGLAWREDGRRRRVLARNPSNPNVEGTRRVLEDAIQLFERNVSPQSSGAHARDVLEVVAGCYMSAETGTRVMLDPAPPVLVDFFMGGTALAKRG
jgi:predicted dehydrogenase